MSRLTDKSDGSAFDPSSWLFAYQWDEDTRLNLQVGIDVRFIPELQTHRQHYTDGPFVELSKPAGLAQWSDELWTHGCSVWFDGAGIVDIRCAQLLMCGQVPISIGYQHPFDAGVEVRVGGPISIDPHDDWLELEALADTGGDSGQLGRWRVTGIERCTRHSEGESAKSCADANGPGRYLIRCQHIG